MKMYSISRRLWSLPCYSPVSAPSPAFLKRPRSAGDGAPQGKAQCLAKSGRSDKTTRS